MIYSSDLTHKLGYSTQNCSFETILFYNYNNNFQQFCLVTHLWRLKLFGLAAQFNTFCHSLILLHAIHLDIEVECMCVGLDLVGINCILAGDCWFPACFAWDWMGRVTVEGVILCFEMRLEKRETC